MEDDRYVLHQKLQDLSSRSGVAVNSLKAMHLVSYTTLYDFLNDPSLARARTLQSVRLIIEFLDGACRARLLPVRRATLNDRGCTKEYYISELYEKWWDNGKKFPGVVGPISLEALVDSEAPPGMPQNKASEIGNEDLDAEIEGMLKEIEQPSTEE